MFKFLRNRKGVTLVEVLAVVVILGIIAAIAVPTIGNLIDNQRESAAETEWSNIEEAARLYAISEEPDTPFSITDMSAYIDFDGTIDDLNDTDLSTVLLFDSDGNLVAEPNTTDGTFDTYADITDYNSTTTTTYTGIFIDGYQVAPDTEDYTVS